MKTPVKAGLILAGIVTLINLLIPVVGLHRNALVAGFGAVVLYLIINVVMVWWSLSRTADANGYGKQLLDGLILGVVGGVVILITSLVPLQLLFPDYLPEMAESILAAMEQAGMPQEAIDERAAMYDRATPFGQAMAGAIGTVVTSVVAAAIIAIFKRKK